MSTTLDQTRATTHGRSLVRGGNFYVWMAVACIVVSVGGFAPTYWLPLATGAFMNRGPLVNLHGALFAAWPFFFLWQTWLTAQGRFEHHQASGVAGVSVDRIYYLLVVGGKPGVPLGFNPTPPVMASVPGGLRGWSSPTS